MGSGLLAVLALVTSHVAAQWNQPINTQGWYSVVASKTIRPFWEYHAAVSVENVGQPTTVVVEISGRQDSGVPYKNSQYVSVEPYVTRIVRIQIGDLGPGEYNLTARGEGGLAFVNSTALKYSPKSLSILVQTDRAVYKPGSKVQFRALVLDSFLKPAVTGSIDVFVTDGEGNRVKEWKRVLTTRGVYSGQFELSDSPVLGDWNIHVIAQSQTTLKSFQVAEYVLPKFEVSINVPPHSLFRDSRIAADIRAKYTYGRPVKGEATVTMLPTYFSDSIQPIYQNPVRKVIPIDGKATVDFEIVRELNLTDDYERMIKFEVTVEESLTGRRQNSSAITTLHEHKYHLELVKTADFFKPGLRHTAYVKLTQFDGTPVINSNLPLKIKSGYSTVSEEYEETSYEISSNGLIKLTFDPPKNATIIGIEATYAGVTEWFPSISAALSPSQNYIQATIHTENPQVGSDIEVEVTMTEPAKFVNYQVIGRGDVLLANTVNLRNNATSAMWRFGAIAAMAPKSKLIVHYVRPDGELVADSQDIEIDEALRNFVKIDPAQSEVEPGSNIELRLKTKPNSYIGLLGVDQSVLLLKKGNDISKEDVYNELKTFDGPNQVYMGMQGALTAQLAFDNSGVVVLTNGFVYESTPWIHYRSNFDDLESAAFETGGVGVLNSVTGSAGSAPRLRSNFPETWLWQTIDTDYDGSATIRKNVPDTITSWVVSAFSVDSLFGLGLVEEPAKVKVFRPFFVSLDLPYSIVRGEVVTIPVVVFNYMSREVTADVTMENDGKFEFSDISNDVNDSPKVELFRRKQVKVPANSAQSTSFMITASEIGYISIKVSARSALAGDAVDKRLLVKPEGETQYQNDAVFIDLRNTNKYKTNVTLRIPEYYVPDSEYIEVSAVGDILGPALPNLDKLIRMPFGCGEQNMLNFVPNIVVLDYWKATGQITPALEGKSLKYIETGYQRELSYKHKDGSFSAFGNSDPSGSTWLTAFVLKSFAMATPYLSIENKVIEEGLAWLARVQAPNGSFPEVGTVSHKDMQGGSGQGVALTAYTLLAFLSHRRPEHSNSVNKAIDYIVKRLQSIEDTYSLSIVSYALHLANHPAKETAFNLLELRANTTSSMKFWKRSARKSDEKNPHAYAPNSIDVEMTSYGLMTYLERGLEEDAIPIMKWLVSQQNQDGGFASTQDTVIALTALSKLAERISVKSPDVTVTFSYGKGISTDIRVSASNAAILQKMPIPRRVREVNITATGSGFAIVQVSYRYNVNVTGAWPLFNLDPQVDKNSNINHLQLSICSSFVTGIEGNGDETSNMAVMEVTLPSGYTVDQDSLPSLQSHAFVKRVETKEADTQVVLYFDKMTREEYCPTVSAFRTHKVAKQKPVPVSLYDYYDQSRRARAFYSPLVATECDICEGEDCGACTGKASYENLDGDGAANLVVSTSALLLSAMIFAFFR